MPAPERMSWSKTQRRWYKRYRGKLHWISPRTLGCEPTREASRTAANKWWEAKQTEIDRTLGEARKLPSHVVEHYEEALERHRKFAAWQRRFGTPADALPSEHRMEILQGWLKKPDPPFPLSKTVADPLYEIEKGLPLSDVADFRIFWDERFQVLRKVEGQEQATPQEQTVVHHIDGYLELRKAQAQAKGKLGSYLSFAQWLRVFADWIGPNSPLESLNEDLWEKYFIHLSNKMAAGEYSPSTAKNYRNAARAFVTRCVEKRLIDAPRNLKSKQLAISVPYKDPVTFTPEEIQTHVGAAKPKMKLYILLMLNCGMYPHDISELRQGEVDWENGRINRKRTKTRDSSENVPKVDYPLWPSTFALLKQFRSEDPERVLVNEDGKPLWVESISTNGKLNRNSNIQSAYFQLQKKVPEAMRRGLKTLRKTGASLLEQSAYGRFSEHYLGEAPKTTASRHYSHRNGSEFDEAVKWLGTQLGIAELSTTK